MRVLGIDTATGHGSVAVIHDETVSGEVRLAAPDAHSTRLLGAVDYLLAALGLAMADLDGLALTLGPGSFTGLRVGIATVQGLSFASGLPVVGVSTLDALAHRMRGVAERLVVLMDAYREGLFVGIYDREGVAVGAPRVARPADLFGMLPAGAAFIGEGALRHRPEIESACPGAVFPDRSPFLAATAARLARAPLAAGAGVTADLVRPLYLREPHIGPPRP